MIKGSGEWEKKWEAKKQIGKFSQMGH